MSITTGLFLIFALVLAWGAHDEFKSNEFYQGGILFLIGLQSFTAAVIL